MPDRYPNEAAAQRMSSGPVPTGTTVGRIDSCRFVTLDQQHNPLAKPGESIDKVRSGKLHVCRALSAMARKSGHSLLPATRPPAALALTQRKLPPDRGPYPASFCLGTARHGTAGRDDYF